MAFTVMVPLFAQVLLVVSILIICSWPKDASDNKHTSATANIVFKRIEVGLTSLVLIITAAHLFYNQPQNEKGWVQVIKLIPIDLICSIEDI